MFCLLFANCSHLAKRIESSDVSIENNNIREIAVIENISKSLKINLSTIASNIDYCILETDKKCLVTPNMSIYCSKKYIVTIGGDQVHDVCYVFERSTGKFVRQISRSGQGPEEYMQTIGSFWDGNNEQVCVLNHPYYLFFNLDGTLSHKIERFKHHMNSFIVYRDCYVGYTPNQFGDNTIRIAFYDKTGALIDSIPNYRTWERTQSWWGWSSDAKVYDFYDELYYKDIYGDTLFHIKDHKLQPRYIFNTGGLAVPYEIQEGGRYDLLAAIRGDEYDRYEQYIVILEIVENTKHLFFTIEHRKQLYPAIYDKTEDELQIMPSISIPPLSRDRMFPLYGFENDLDGGLPFWPKQMVSEKEMMCVFTAEELLELDASIITDEKLKNVLNNLEIDSNPVVAIVTLKD